MTESTGELFPEVFAYANEPTPVMAQYMRAKARAGAALLFFRLGDFYELFFDDARVASRVLGLTLTSRSKDKESGEAIPMAGVPVRSVNTYLRRLVQVGYTVAICEQMQEPKQAKGIIDRDVVRIITAGTLTEDELLDGAKSNFLAAAAFEQDRAGLAWCDLSTGRFVTCEIPRASLGDELARLSPAELLISEKYSGKPEEKIVSNACASVITPRSDASFVIHSARRRLCEAFGVATLEGFGVDDTNLGVAAAGAVFDYLKDTQRAALSHLKRLELHHAERFVVLDRATREALELTDSLRDGGRAATLLGVMDQTRTAMGGRRLREWLLAPLRNATEIKSRQSAVAELYETPPLRLKIRLCFDEIADLERILGRVGCERGSPADLGHLRRSLAQVPKLILLLNEHAAAREGWSGAAAELLNVLGGLDPCDEIRKELDRAIVDSPPLVSNEGGIIREGYNSELDELRVLSHDSKGWLEKLELKESARTGIVNLKVGFHRVHGYFIEVTNIHVSKIPADYARIQTLKDRERYSTNELREFEAKVRGAETRSIEIEKSIFEAVRRKVASHAQRLLATARALADLDAIASLAEVAQVNRYIRPEMDESTDLEITEGRHPVVERFSNEPFVPNNTNISDDARLIVLTGPNMAGKSTYLRQIALIVLLAQAGSFVPAKHARIGVVDRISTRIGASDDLARGRSTFLVEMVETSAILNHATDRSLVVLDEVGRGTSTFDGLAIAWAVAEYLTEKVRARTIFATHYHELNELAAKYPAVRNYRVDVKEWGDRVVFLRQVVEGGTDRSFGLHVARLAGIPPEVLVRAREVLRAVELEAVALAPKILNSGSVNSGNHKSDIVNKQTKPLFNPAEEAAIAELSTIDVERLTPIEALLTLKRLRESFR
ncbi:MAG: DNA mismatch repair protein MutS [Planctomycetota bacterium]